MHNNEKPTYIHEREDWTHFHWDASQLTGLLELVNRETGYLAGRLSAIGFDTQLQTAAETLASDIVASSAIEGIILNAKEVRSSVARRLGIQVQGERATTHYVEGIVEMMIDATVNFSAPLTDERLFAWHAALFPTGRSGMEPIHVGAYRTEPMKVVSGMFGRETVHYRAPAPERLPEEMARFLQWVNSDAVPPSHIKSALAHLWFVSIHPFDDGNGRIARALSDMILAQTERNGQRFYSVSAEINKEKNAYYDVLERTQRGESDVTAWLKWHLGCIVQAVRHSYDALSGVLRKSMFWRAQAQTVLSERQKMVLNAYLDGYEAKLTIKNYAKVAKVSTDTAARDLHDLVEKGVAHMEKGKVRDASFSLRYGAHDHGLRQLECFAEDGAHGIAGVTSDGRKVSERISDIDYLRLQQEEITLQDLADKYFSFLKL